MAAYTIRYNRTTDHIEGISERSKGSQMNYALSACPALSRSGARFAVGKSSDDLAEIMKSFGKTRKACKKCLEAAQAVLDALKAEGNADANEKFERILDLEQEVKGARASVACQTAGVPLYRRQQMHDALERAKADLYAAIDGLTAEELSAFGEYRLQH